MATPQFILDLREKIGHDQLWLPGVSIVVVDGSGRLLLGRRADNGHWTVVSGIPEPGEQPAAAARRECVEETGVDPEVLGICSVSAEHPFAFPNGDKVVFMGTCFVGRADHDAVAATRVGDEESTEVGWFSPDALPQPLAPTTVTRINDAQAWLASPTRAARFES